MQKWHYHWIKADTAEKLYAQLVEEGESGWELVSVTTAALPPGMLPAGSGAAFQAWLRRPKAA